MIAGRSGITRWCYRRDRRICRYMDVTDEVAELVEDRCLLGRRVAEALLASDAGLRAAMAALTGRDVEPVY